MNVLLSFCPFLWNSSVKRKLSGWKPFRGTGAEKRAGYAVKTYEEVTVYMGIFRCDGGTAARTKS